MQRATVLASPVVRSSDDVDGELVRRCLAGDLEAFGELVSRHQDVAVRVAARIAGSDESEDVAQDAFLRAFHRLDRFRGDASFRAWLLQIVRNSALDSLAAQKRRPEPAADPEPDGGRSAAGPQTPVDALDVRERRERLRTKLRLLPEQHRAVLVLRDLEGLSYDEIAATTGTPLGSVKGRLHRARTELADLLRSNTYDWRLPRAP